MGGPILSILFQQREKRKETNNGRNGTEGRIGSMGVHVHISLHHDIKTVYTIILYTPADCRFGILTWISRIFTSLNMVVCNVCTNMYVLLRFDSKESVVWNFLKSNATEIILYSHTN